MTQPFKYIFGPVYSWRLGNSLGVDPLSTHEKTCNMDCVYCQLGKTAQLTHERKVYVPVDAVLDEIRRIPLGVADHITFAGRGEPTLALNLGEMIRAVKSTRPEKVAVLTNSSLMDNADVRNDLMAADFVLAKLDAGDQSFFNALGQGGQLDLDKIVQGIRAFRKDFKGKLALQIMFMELNIENAGQIAKIARLLGADEVELDTPLRPCGVKPLGRERLEWARKFFEDMKVVSVYDAPLKTYTPIDEKATMDRHGDFRKTSFKN
jgi:wyosine [tRNA(Phe)-imidazoG37] synthetase (radical SAM superfamily)